MIPVTMLRSLFLASATALMTAAAAVAQGVPADEVLAPPPAPSPAPTPAPADDAFAPPGADGPFAVPADDPFAAQAGLADPADDFSSVIRGERVVMRGLNKVTAATRDFTIEFDQPLQFGSLTVLARTCSRRPPELIPETFVFLEIYERAFESEEEDEEEPSEYGEKIFSGWMLGSSPALHGLEHPVYDIWPVACQAPGDEQMAAEAAAQAEAAAAAQEANEEASDPANEVFRD
jgi:hypothetical protein